MQAQYWLMAIRPRTLPAAISPLLLGNVLAWSQAEALSHPFSYFIALCALLCGVLLQIAVNLANDYFDYKSGVDTQERLGPVRVSQAGLLPPSSVRNAMIGCLVLAVLVGLYLIGYGGWPVALMALLAVLGALGYSGGPYPLASLGLGEIAAFAYFGLMTVVGVYFIQTGSTSFTVWLLGAALGLFNAAIMLVNNTRDISTDLKANKRTLAVRIGQANARLLYRVLVSAPFVLAALAWGLGTLPLISLLAVAVVIPMALSLASAFVKTEGGALNPLLGKTAQLTLFFGLLCSVGLIFTGLY